MGLCRRESNLDTRMMAMFPIMAMGYVISRVMNQRVCILLVATVWLSGMTYAVSEATVTLQLPLCVRNTLDHLLCEIPVLIKTACGEKGANELTLSVVCIFFLAVPLCLILISYACIGHTVFKIKSLGGRKKAFGTCSSHLVVVFLFYGPGISMYLQPPSSFSKRPTQVHGSLLWSSNSYTQPFHLHSEK